MYNGYKMHDHLEPQYASSGTGSLIAGCALSLYTGSEFFTKGFVHLLHMPAD